MAGLSSVEISNLALGHLGVAKTITSLDERSSEARACKRFYTLARDTTQSRYPWKNGLRRVALAVLPDNAWVDEFPFAYRAPSDAKWFRGIRIPGAATGSKPPPHLVVSDTTGQVVVTAIENAIGEYSVLVEEPAKWTDEQVNATAYKLAALMARTFDEDNASAVKREMEQYFEVEISRAEAKDLNTDEPPDPPKSEFETCRY